MRRITRRELLQATGGGAAVAKTGGLAAILATGRAPAYAQTTQIHWLKWNDFVPAGDQLLRRQLLGEAEKALGIKINLETIGLNDLQARVTAAIQSQSGADITMAFNNNAQLYAESCVDVSDVCEELAASQGGFYDLAKAQSHDGRKWVAVPYCIIGAMVAYRKSWFDEIGVTTFPETWEAYREAGRKLKARGRPIGQSLGHTVGDAPAFCYPLMWSFGGREVEADGKTVKLNSKETIESVKFMTAFWKEAHDEGGLAWDDSNNNRAFLSGTISSTLNGASIYIEALRKPDQYKTDSGAQMRTDILHAPLPRGAHGQFGVHPFQNHMVMGYSKNQKAAKEFLRWFHSPAVYEKWFVVQKGFATGPTRSWENHKVWDEDPVMAPYRVAGRLGLVYGHAGPAGQKAAEVLSKYIIVDMYAKAVQGMSAEDAVKWAEAEVKKVYGTGA
ncbi:extracellular solute-binding protein [Vineibacter terrae]|uniref:Extracellular solute-binding protein n=1 Tax=Vineibacter terrae TaxID=2586908 RepID=A0A5C8PBN0_9HYPH|nr:extracellular solute-binding protein [Vineibacter terrae]TXL70660.1 extracellular solute-binding protein [Vineibacter terrae]